MTSPKRQDSESKSRPGPAPLPHEQDTFTFPTLCDPGCSCDGPAKNGAWKRGIMLLVIAVVVISMIYKEII